jgi:hypothetical protein
MEQTLSAIYLYDAQNKLVLSQQVDENVVIRELNINVLAGKMSNNNE